jgi:ankyrin repeat protein
MNFLDSIIHKRNLEQALALIQQDPDVELNFLYGEMNTYWAARNPKFIEFIKRYIQSKSGRREIQEAEANHDGFLANAIRAGYDPEIIQALLDNGAHPDTPSLRGRWKREVANPLHEALRNPDMVRTLLAAGADVNVLHDGCIPPLGRALLAYSFGTVNPEDDVVQMLLSAGANPKVSIQTSDRCSMKETETLRKYGIYEVITPLFLIARGEHIRVMADGGADWKARDNVGRGVLHNKYVTVDIIERAIGAGVDAAARDVRGDTAAHVQEDPDALCALIRGGCPVNSRNALGQTPLHCAANVQIVIALLNCGADPIALDNNGKSPLHVLRDHYLRKEMLGKLPDSAVAALSGPIPTAKNLEKLADDIGDGKSGALKKLVGTISPNTFVRGKPLFVYALRANTLDIFEQMVKMGADLKIRWDNWHGGTILHELAMREAPDTAAMIAHIAPLCDLDVTDKYGKTALGVAGDRRTRKDSAGDYRILTCQALIDAGMVPSETDVAMGKTATLRLLMQRAKEGKATKQAPHLASIAHP